MEETFVRLRWNCCCYELAVLLICALSLPLNAWAARYQVSRSGSAGDRWTCSSTSGCAQQCLQPMRQCPPGQATWRSDQQRCVSLLDGKPRHLHLRSSPCTDVQTFNQLYSIAYDCICSCARCGKSTQRSLCVHSDTSSCTSPDKQDNQ